MKKRASKSQPKSQLQLPRDIWFEVADGTDDFWVDFRTERFKPEKGWHLAHYVLARDVIGAVEAAENDIVATAMSYVGTRERERRLWRRVDSDKPLGFQDWKEASRLTSEFEDKLFKECRRLRKMLKKLAGKKKRSK